MQVHNIWVLHPLDSDYHLDHVCYVNTPCDGVQGEEECLPCLYGCKIMVKDSEDKVAKEYLLINIHLFQFRMYQLGLGNISILSSYRNICSVQYQ